MSGPRANAFVAQHGLAARNMTLIRTSWLEITRYCAIGTSRKMSDLRMVIMPKDAKPEEVQHAYDDYASKYDEVCYKYYLL